MQYNHLGATGLKVSALSLGAWVTYGSTKDEEMAYNCMTVALRGGVNFFDNAEGYAAGRAETVMGNVVKRWEKEGLCHRSDLVISTKLFGGHEISIVKGTPNATGASRKHLLEGMSASLQRLQMSYVDLLFIHRPDPSTPIEETVRAVDFLINQGKVFYWGTSEWSAQEITEAHAVAKQFGLHAPKFEQPQYNMLHRTRFEVEYEPLYVQFRMGTTIWSPLASGLLSGKYSEGVVPEGSRLSMTDGGDGEWIQHLKRQFESGEGFNGLDFKRADPMDVFRTIDTLKPLATRLGCSLSQLALAWTLKNPHVSTAICGASRPEQMEQNLKALEIVPKLTPEVMHEVDELLKNKPAAKQNWGRGVKRVANAAW